MFTNRTKSGRANIVGINIAKMRKQLKLSQREVADRLTAIGLTIDKNAIQRMESGSRFITDIELIYIAKLFSVSVSALFIYEPIPDEVKLNTNE